MNLEPCTGDFVLRCTLYTHYMNHTACNSMCTHLTSLILLSGFMCGLCQESNDTNDMRIGVDLTLRACKKCGPTDAVVLAIVCESLLLLTNTQQIF